MSAQTLFAKLASGAPLAPSERTELESIGARLDQLDQVQTSQAQPGTSDPFFENLRWRTAEGVVLPHECACLAATSVEIADNSDTVPSWEDIDDTWSKGLDYDETNGYIYVNNLPRDAVVLILGWCKFPADADGDRWLKLNDNLTADLRSVYTEDSNSGWATTVQLVHLQALATDVQYYRLRVGHTSGAAVNVDAMFSVMRVR